MSRCEGKPTNARNLTVTTATAALQGLGWRQGGGPGSLPEGRVIELERCVLGANAKASYKLSVSNVGHTFYLWLPTHPGHFGTRESNHRAVLEQHTLPVYDTWQPEFLC